MTKAFKEGCVKGFLLANIIGNPFVAAYFIYSDHYISGSIFILSTILAIISLIRHNDILKAELIHKEVIKIRDSQDDIDFVTEIMLRNRKSDRRQVNKR